MNWDIIGNIFIDWPSVVLGFVTACIFVRLLFAEEIRRGKQK